MPTKPCSFNRIATLSASTYIWSNNTFPLRCIGDRIAIEYNGQFYYYIYNAQGDVVGLIDCNETTVVEYKYDSWGKLLSVTGSLASTLGNGCQGIIATVEVVDSERNGGMAISIRPWTSVHEIGYSEGYGG